LCRLMRPAAPERNEMKDETSLRFGSTEPGFEPGTYWSPVQRATTGSRGPPCSHWLLPVLWHHSRRSHPFPGALFHLLSSWGFLAGKYTSQTRSMRLHFSSWTEMYGTNAIFSYSWNVLDVLGFSNWTTVKQFLISCGFPLVPDHVFGT